MQVETNEKRVAPSSRAGSAPLDARQRARGLRDTVSEVLARTIEAEIIPRLMLAHRSEPPVAEPVALGTIAVECLADLVLNHDAHVAVEHVEVLRRQGYSIESLLLDLLAPTARLLGDNWLSDRSTFADVTIGLTRLQRVLRSLIDGSGDALAAQGGEHAVLLLPARNEQHTFGLSVVEAFFRLAGWDVTTGEDEAHAPRLVRGTWFDVVGFTASCESRLESLAATIRSTRRLSRNSDLRVLVGGPLFLSCPDLAARVGADATARDGRAACETAERLIAKSVA